MAIGLIREAGLCLLVAGAVEPRLCSHAKALICTESGRVLGICPHKRDYRQLIISDDKPTSAGSETRSDKSKLDIRVRSRSPVAAQDIGRRHQQPVALGNP